MEIHFGKKNPQKSLLPCISVFNLCMMTSYQSINGLRKTMYTMAVVKTLNFLNYETHCQTM